MSKDALREKLIDFQREILQLSSDIQSQEKAFQDGEDHLMQGLFQVLDAFENIFRNLEGKEAAFEKPMRRALTSFTGIQRKITRILEVQGIEPIRFPDRKATVGLCKVLETRAIAGHQDGEIIAVVQTGYRCKDRVLRPAEVICAKGGER